MQVTTAEQTLDRHALVTPLWLTAGLVAATLFHYGLGQERAAFLLAAFGVILIAFAGHVIVNGLTGLSFSRRELALGLVLYVVALVGFGIATLVQPGFGAVAFLPVSLGFLGVFAAVVFSMVTQAGVRGAFESFDVIRTFRPVPRRTGDRPE